MIKITNVIKKYTTKEVLKSVSLTVEGGEIYGLIGKNGAGKTTLMNIIAGILSSDEGEVELKDAQGKSLKLGYLPDLPAFFEYMNASEYMDFLLKNGDRDRRNRLLNMVNLTGNERISNMSRGMRQRLGIAAALVNDPDVILLDEPTSALDPQGRIEVMQILGDLKAHGKSVLLSTHILADMEKVCDRVGFFAEGKLVKEMRIGEFEGSVSTMYFTFASKPDASFFADLSNIKCEEALDNVLRMDAIGGNINGAQQELFERLGKYDNTVIGMRLDMSDLDTLFQEVCL